MARKARKEHVVAVFFDLEKAYDTTWRFSILQKLRTIGLTGQLPRFIANFLTSRLFKVRIGNVESNIFEQIQGVPQGSVLSCTLFSLAINDLLSDLPPYIQTSLYVDDFAVFSRSTSLPAAVRRTQLAVNKAHLWCDRHGFKFSTSKSVVMHFTKIRGAFPPIDIQLGSFTLPFVNETKFLGLLLDRKLSYIPHIKLVRTKCL